jgi:glycosyltransferase involved in cell wall biosynthesis
MRQADCGIFPSRAEGWNLGLLEMLSCGKPCITTNYSAHTEFCNKENSFLIDIGEFEPAYDGKWFFGQGSWAKMGQKQIDQCIEYMRHVYRNKIITNTEGIKTAEQFSWTNSAKLFCDNLS